MARTARAELAEQFVDPDQQSLADRLGMWLFLGTEIMLFGGLFMAIAVTRVIHAEAVKEASSHLYLWLGGANTAVLLTSSLSMAIAVTAARSGARRLVLGALVATVALGAAFLAIKATEYGLEYSEGLVPHIGPPSPLVHPAATLFLNLYFVGTGLHAIHLAIGIAITGGVAIRIARRSLDVRRRHVVLEMTGLYWHLIDVVWVFLFPALYLIGR